MDEMLYGAHIFAGYGQGDVLQGVSMTLRAGELCAVLGENGSGKSTLLRTVCGLLPFRGSLALCGSPLSSLDRRELARRIGYLSQRSRVTLELSAMEIVLMGFRAYPKISRTPLAPHIFHHTALIFLAGPSRSGRRQPDKRKIALSGEKSAARLAHG